MAAKKSSAKAKVTQLPVEKRETFIRMKELPMKPGDVYQGYQVEQIIVLGDQIIERKLVGKPNVFEMAFSSAGELIDPRNEN